MAQRAPYLVEDVAERLRRGGGEGARRVGEHRLDGGKPRPVQGPAPTLGRDEGRGMGRGEGTPEKVSVSCEQTATCVRRRRRAGDFRQPVGEQEEVGRLEPVREDRRGQVFAGALFGCLRQPDLIGRIGGLVS